VQQRERERERERLIPRICPPATPTLGRRLCLSVVVVVNHVGAERGREGERQREGGRGREGKARDAESRGTCDTCMHSVSRFYCVCVGASQ